MQNLEKRKLFKNALKRFYYFIKSRSSFPSLSNIPSFPTFFLFSSHLFSLSSPHILPQLFFTITNHQFINDYTKIHEKHSQTYFPFSQIYAMVFPGHLYLHLHPNRLTYLPLYNFSLHLFLPPSCPLPYSLLALPFRAICLLFLHLHFPLLLPTAFLNYPSTLTFCPPPFADNLLTSCTLATLLPHSPLLPYTVSCPLLLYSPLFSSPPPPSSSHFQPTIIYSFYPRLLSILFSTLPFLRSPFFL